MATEQECPCLNGPLRFDRYEEIRTVGTDTTDGRYGAMTILRCRQCNRRWLHYQVEYEAFTASGRYFMGLITREEADKLAPEGAVDYLNSLNWHLYGGSYFGGCKGKSTGDVRVDL